MTGRTGVPSTTPSASPLRGELQDRLALADHAEILSGGLLDAEGIAAKALDGAAQRLAARPQGRQVALQGLDLLHEAGHLHEAADPEPGQRQHQSGHRAEGEGAASHRPVRVYRLRPGHDAAWPSSSSMRRSWLYLAIRSPREREPVLIWPALTATARSATKVSSVSPERCEMTVP